MSIGFVMSYFVPSTGFPCTLDLVVYTWVTFLLCTFAASWMMTEPMIRQQITNIAFYTQLTMLGILLWVIHYRMCPLHLIIHYFI